MLDYARTGDTVVVTAIDRLGRSVAEVTRAIAELSERRILLRALREGKGPGPSAPSTDPTKATSSPTLP
jgi:DNA invertase Pin-like site-specific DNA recombinase